MLRTGRGRPHLCAIFPDRTCVKPSTPPMLRAGLDAVDRALHVCYRPQPDHVCHSTEGRSLMRRTGRGRPFIAMRQIETSRMRQRGAETARVRMFYPPCCRQGSTRWTGRCKRGWCAPRATQSSTKLPFSVPGCVPSSPESGAVWFKSA